MTDRACPQCRTPAAPDHRFCGRCGSALPVECAGCLAVVGPGLAFCTSCGDPAAANTAAITTREERRTVSILFLDLAGFTRMAERLDPEDLRELQLAYFSTARAIVHRSGGILEKYIGDAVVAVFGVPVESEHDATRAVQAGLALQRALDAQPLAGRYRMRARVGIATGEALVDLAAARDNGEAMVSGDVVATAARLQHHAPDGAVVVSAATRRATVGSVRYTGGPRQITVAGKEQPVEVWQALGMAGRLQLVDDDAVPLVGRDQELDLVTSALLRCLRDRQTRLLSVVGVHGVGKSRLVRELARRIEAMPDVLVRWRTGRCLPYGEGGPYAALAEIVKAQADVLDTDDEPTARARLCTALAEVVAPEHVERYAELLGPLAGLRGRAVNAGEIEAAWREVLLALAGNLPTVLVVEDLHFADPAMVRFLAGLTERAGDVPLFVICTFRPELIEDHPSWASGPAGSLTTSLAPLRGAALRRLVTTLLRRHRLPESLTERLAAITGGNPMYVVEYVRMLAERAAHGDLDPNADLSTPETVHGVVANRIDLLDDTERTVLHAAAVLGDSVWPGAVTTMLGLPDGDVQRALHGLRRRDMLVAGGETSAVGGEPELAFRHQLVRDVAYRRLPRVLRANLHRRAADWFEGQSVTGRHDLAAPVARHRVAALSIAVELGQPSAADTEAARRALLCAADAAFAVYAVRPALAHLEQALTLWPADQTPVDRLGAELQRRRLEFLADGDRFYRDGGAKDLLRIAERMREAGDVVGAARAETLLGQAEYMRAELDRAAEHLGRAVTLFGDLPPSADKATAYSELARLHVMRYRPAKAVAAAGVARELAEQLGLADAAASAMVTEATARYLDGDPAGLPALRGAVETCRRQLLPELRRAAHNLSVLLLEEGDLCGAAAAAAESTAAHGMQVSLVISHSTEAERAYFTGDWETLLNAADQYFDTEPAETTGWDMQLRTRRAWLRSLRGESPGAELDASLESARRSELDRMMYNACANGALFHALHGEETLAAALLGELTSVWQRSPTAMTFEWLSAVAHAGALTPGAAAVTSQVVATVPHRTRWVAAAEALTAAGRATAAGEHAAAVEAATRAVERYDAIGSISDAVLAAVTAVRAARAADDTRAAAELTQRVRAFAERNRAPGLLTLLD
ncbi:MAG TPA: adenylate/guanylate cyclase domain-containing protein [Actinoplanes sp.]|nr:adenylate/guanylate cyclase domain-containing protein [Actinoplanes sp.]